MLLTTSGGKNFSKFLPLILSKPSISLFNLFNKVAIFSVEFSTVDKSLILETEVPDLEANLSNSLLI
jgi:hypothetical protein